MNTRLSSPWVALAVATAMLTITMPAMASHNSFGAPHTHVLDPDEFNDAGELVPDIPHEEHPNPERVATEALEETSVYNLDWHETLEEDGLELRSAPFDQSGDRYTDCKGPSAYDAPSDTYDEALRNGEACYVGYMDQIVEYAFPTAPLIVTECPCDLLYPVNPAPDDQYCRGEEETNEHTGIGPVDETVTGLERTTDSDCGDGQDNSYLTGDLRIDVSLLESGTETAAGALGNDVGSGSFILEGSPSTYTFLFGQPHPDVDPDEDRFEAGSGPFGPNPAELGNPLHDLTGACGDRTQECKLLTPDDITAYDPWTWSEEFSDIAPPEQARVCAFLPQYSFAVATDQDGDIDRNQGVCGNTGNQLDEFVTSTTAGGFGIEEGPPTWLTNLPGWSWGVTFLGIPQDQWDTYVEAYEEDELEHRSGFINYYAVNPIVPDREGDLRCVVPNILTDGDNSVLEENGFSGYQDPGVYGAYRADAIDVDVYPHAFRPQLEGINEATHEALQPVLGPVLENASVPSAGDVVDLVEDQIVYPADYLESSDAPAHAQPGEQNQRPFQASIQDGIACDGANDLRFNEEETPMDAGLRFQASVSTETVHLKDPTLVGEDGLPVEEAQTDEGYWQADVYSFDGQAQAVIDFSDNGQFDECPGANVDPGDDLCPWEALWDAYSGDQCANRDNKPCGEILEDRGYDLDEGVGGYFVLEVTGPTFVTSTPGTTDQARVQEQTQLLGDGNPTAQNCLVGTTIGFEEKITNFFAADSIEGVLDELCDVDGETAFVADAFSPQDGVNPGVYSSQVSWAPLVPTPQESGFGEGDSLCVTGIWTVTDEVQHALDTAGENNIRLEGGQVHQFAHWQSLETGTDTPDDRATC